MNFKLGDIVIKNTGGNKMSIQSIDGSVVKCGWFVGNEYFSSDFNISDILPIFDYKKLLQIEKREDVINNILSIKS